MSTFADRVAAIQRDERRAEADYYALCAQLQYAPAEECDRLQRAKQLAYDHWQMCLAERRRLDADRSADRLYRERGA
jgi:hypothetical protein